MCGAAADRDELITAAGIQNDGSFAAFSSLGSFSLPFLWLVTSTGLDVSHDDSHYDSQSQLLSQWSCHSSRSRYPVGVDGVAISLYWWLKQRRARNI